jgi:predicted phage terminase large subunit-like protein
VDGLDYQRHSILAYGLARIPKFEIAQHHLIIGRKLNAFAAGKIKRLIITAPPRHGKSILCSELFPPWFLGKYPDKRVMFATYGGDLSQHFGKKVKMEMQSPEFKRIFPACQLIDDSKSYKSMSTTDRGEYFATSIGGSATGKGADRLIIDDPIKDRKTAQSKAYIKEMMSWWRSTALTRLQPDGGALIMATRWVDNDLTGQVLKEDEGIGDWDQVHFPAVDKNGNALWHEFMDEAQLLAKKISIGSYEFESLYQGNPSPPKSGFLKTELIGGLQDYWITEHKETPTILSIDSATKEKEMNDYSVISAWKHARPKMACVDVVRERLEFPKLEMKTRQMVEKWNPSAILIEDKSSGTQLLQILRSTGWPIIPMPAVTDKITRAIPLQAQIEAGNVFMVDNLNQKQEFLDELGLFPNAEFDDFVDSSSQAVSYMNTQSEIQTFKNPLRR